MKPYFDNAGLEGPAFGRDRHHHGDASAMSRSNEAAPESLWRRVVKTVALWRERSRQRVALAELSDYQLRDIGISRAEALREAEKLFWR